MTSSLRFRSSVGVFVLMPVLAAACSSRPTTTDAASPTDATSSLDVADSLSSDSPTAADSAPPSDACAFTLCGDLCIDTSSDLRNCGSCGFVCPGTVSNQATCAGGMCYVLLPPRQIAPISTTTVSTHRPLFRWELQGRETGAVVEICRDRACTAMQSFPAEGTSLQLPSALDPGVWYWSVRGTVPGGEGTSPSVVWPFTVPHRDTAVSTTGASVFDVNGDGFADAIIGAGPNGTLSGSASIWTGGPAGLSGTAAFVRHSPIAGDSSFGVAVASAGDVDGDGYADLIVGAGAAAMGEGRVVLYRGGPGGLADTPWATLAGAVRGRVGMLGESVSTLGDVNGDGYTDVVAGGVDGASPGDIFVFMGRAQGLDGEAPIVVPHPNLGTVGIASFGTAMSGGGDVNGDGYPDLAVGAVDTDEGGGVFLYLGGPDGLASTPSANLSSHNAAFAFGESVSATGDLNGDGYADIVVGTDSNVVYVYYGSATGISDAPSATVTQPAGPPEQFGQAVSSAGDINGDGFDDLVIGGYRKDMSQPTGLVTHVYLGSASGIGRNAAIVRFEQSTQFQARPRAASGGDFNGDGLADVLAGRDQTSVSGIVFVYAGAPDGMILPVGTLTDPDGAIPTFGVSLAP